jgi:hypothetical protein
MPNVQFKVQPKHDLTMMDRVMELVNSFHNSKNAGKMSILSPKLFPLVPGRKNRPHLLSPTLFSFQRDGYFSLPQLFQVSPDYGSSLDYCFLVAHLKSIREPVQTISNWFCGVCFD